MPKTPAEFRLDPMPMHDRPNPGPPRFLKTQIYTNPSVFKAIDQHAIDEARTNYRTFRDLIWHLVYKKKDFGQLEKARTIFRWMTTKNMYTIMFDSMLPNSPEELMAGFKDGKTTYAKIFECLCLHAGLHCVCVSGWAKGVEYRPGQHLTKGAINHSWNAVFINGDWQLIDSHWATRYLQAERNTVENLVYEYDDFYFLTEPAQLIFSHCPEEAPWQLLHPARSRSQFEEFPLVKSYFFSVGMEFLQQRQGVVHTRKGLLTITLGYNHPAAFTFKLSYGESMMDTMNGLSLKRYVIQETTEDRVTFYLRAPREGVYYMTVFAQQAGDRISQENIFKAACEYKILCDQAAQDLRPYPMCSDSNWGPGIPVQQYGMEATHKTAILPIPRNGVAEVGFKRTRDVRVFPKLVKDGMDPELLERSVMTREQDDMVYVSVRLPAAGEYGLEIYANEPAREGDTFTHVCQYLCSHLDRDFSAQYGQVYDRADLVALTKGSTGGGLYQANSGSYGSLNRDGDMRSGPPGSYSGHPDSPAYNQQLRQDEEAFRYGSQPELNQATRRMDNMSMNPGDARNRPQPPGISTLPKPGRSAYGSVGDLPPADLQGRTASSQERVGVEVSYVKTGTLRKDQQRKQPVEVEGVPSPTLSRKTETGSGKQPVEVNYVPSPTLERKASGDVKTPVEISFVTAAGGDQNKGKQPPPTLPKHAPATLPKPGGATVVVESRGQDARFQALLGSRARSGDPAMLGAEEAFPPPPPELMGDGNRYPGDASRAKGDSNQYGTDGSRYGPDGSRYGPDGSRYGPDGSRYGPDGSRYGPDGSRYGPDGSRYGPDGNRYGPDGSRYGSDGSQYGSDANQYGSDGARYIPIQTDLDSKKLGKAPQGYRHIAHAPAAGVGQGQLDKGWHSHISEPEKEYQPHPQNMYTSSITIHPPQNFKPIPVQPTAAPQPTPPKVPPKPFKDTSIFENVDTHAVEVSKEQHNSFRDLVWHLIYAREIQNELEKARAIFLWLCSKDLSKINFSNVPAGSPEEILMNLRDGKTTYAVVYETLCSYAGLHCRTITGYAKGAEYKPGMEFRGDQGQHSWNAVVVDGTWRLVDCHWAARRLVGKKVSAENVRYELDEYYFMPDPFQLIFTHFPDDSSWQLLPQPITLADFEQLVPVKSAFFKYGLTIVSHKQAVIVVDKEVTITIGCPPSHSEALAFTFTLAFDDGVEEFQGQKLNRFGMQEMNDGCSYVSLRPPKRGVYRLIIYAKDLRTASKEGVYGGVCEYELQVDQALPTPAPFPPCVHTSWGPGDSAPKYELQPLQKGAIFSAVEGAAEVRFRMPRTLRFTAKLKSVGEEEATLGGYILHRVVEDVAVFTVYAPHDGEFGLEIYANDPAVDGNSLFHVYQLLIFCSNAPTKPHQPLPTLPPGYLGAQPVMGQLGLSPASHQDPFIQTSEAGLAIAFNTTQSLRMTSQLINCARNQDLSDYILQQGGDGQVLFQLLLNGPGYYKLQIYGLPFTDTSESLPGVYNYLICYTNAKPTPVLPYPKQYGQWKEGCFLYTPQQGQLSSDAANTELSFKMEVPTAKAVAIVVGDDWVQLERAGGTGPWEGNVPMANKWGKEEKLAVCANYGLAKDNYSTLLEYSLH